MVAKPDEAHRLTDKELAALEKRIAAVYKQARDDMQDQVTAYFQSFAKRDEEMKDLIGTVVNGKEWTEQDYKQWRLAQIGRGQRFEAMRDKLAERMTRANEVAVSYVNDATPGIYSLNRNYAAYTIEQVAGDVGFTLWDEQTVRRLIVEQPDLMPNYPAEKAVKRGIDLAYGQKQIASTVTSSILQGKSIKGVADDLQTRIPTMNRDSAVRTARTAVTGAQNAGRIDSYTAAQKMGIKLEKQWLATLDGRTRHSHAMLDGEHVENDEKFSNGCRFPGDPQGEPSEIYNCRCTLIAYLPAVDTSDAQRRARDPETGESVFIQDMSYEEWAGWKKETNPASLNRISISQCKTTDDVVELFRLQDWFIHGDEETPGWRSDENISLEGIDVESAKQLYSAYEKVFAKFPQLKNKFAAPITAKLNRETYAETTMGFGSGLINVSKRKFSNYEKFLKSYSTEVEKGWFAGGADIFTHELGHAVDDYLSAGLHYMGTTGKKKTDFVSNKVRAQILRENGVKFSDISTDLGEYATMDAHEWFAESFSQYMSAKNPGKCAVGLGKWLEKVMEEIESG